MPVVGELVEAEVGHDDEVVTDRVGEAPQRDVEDAVLGVDRDASPEAVKQAWRSATDKFEPGTGAGQFRMFNEAADVLLDPDRRAAYDASLDAEAQAPREGQPVAEDPPPPPPPSARYDTAPIPPLPPAQ